ncbi:hypothetical protein E2C01_036545 [Portunus trituberculatus]|uniref:Uncharacterized protein n=1 Tax=Portunus trituberculatus TaxID=210409 RepID=A0A5B7F8Z7_PORTR|nr:hypothetical protein [Portunus trituberculatus]
MCDETLNRLLLEGRRGGERRGVLLVTPRAVGCSTLFPLIIIVLSWRVTRESETAESESK